MINELCRMCAVSPGTCSLANTKITPVEGICLTVCDALEQYLSLRVVLDEQLPSEACESCVSQVELLVKFVVHYQKAQMKLNDIRSSVTCDSSSLKATKVTSENTDEVLQDREEGAGTKVTKAHNKICSKRTKSSSEVQKKSKAIFSVEDIEERLGRDLDHSERENVETLIAQKSNRQLFKLVYGHGDDRVWTCHVCHERIKGKYTELRKHCYEEHQAKLMYSCELCPVKFTYIRQYKRHLEKHFNNNRNVEKEKPKTPLSSTETFICEVCGKVLKQKNCLLKHMLTHLPEDRKHSHFCDVCGKGFPAKGMLTSHKKRVHIEGRPYQCKTCGKSYKTQRSWKDHCEAHLGNRTFTCQTCGIKLSSRHCLKLHVLTHTGEKPFNCDVCGRNYHSKSRMLRHKRITHNPNPQFICDVCGKAFRSRTGIEGHKLEHTGEVPNICPICGKAIRAKSNYYAHLKVHRQQASRDAAAAGKQTSQPSTTPAASAEPMCSFVTEAQSIGQQEHMLENVQYAPLITDHQQPMLFQEDRFNIDCIETTITAFPTEQIQFSYTS